MSKPGLAEHNERIIRDVISVAVYALDEGFPMPSAGAIARVTGDHHNSVRKACEALKQDGTILIGPGRRVLEVRV